MCRECKTVKMGFTNEDFPQGTHMCYIYNDDAEREAVIAKFIGAGLNQNEMVGYFAQNTTKKELIEKMEKRGVTITKNLDNLNVSKAQDVYCPGGRFVLEDMIEGLKSFYRNAVSNGFSGARISGEMFWALDHKPGTERLMEYESMGDIVLPEFPLTLICQYDARVFDGETLFNCLKVHPYMIVQGQIVHNPYYMTHEEYMTEQKRLHRRMVES